MGFPPVVKLLKNLYGLHQAPKGWSDLVTTWLVEDYGFKQSISIHVYSHTYHFQLCSVSFSMTLISLERPSKSSIYCYIKKAFQKY